MKPAIITALALATGCMSSARPAEPLTLPSAPPPGPWSVMRDALVGCALDHGLTGDLATRVELGQDGIVMNVFSSYGGSYARCVGTSLMHTRFRAQRGRTFDVSFRADLPQAPAATAGAAVCPEECMTAPACPEGCVCASQCN